MAVSCIVSIVGGEWGGCRRDLLTSKSGVHNLVADKNTRLLSHRHAYSGEDADAIIVGPVVPVEELEAPFAESGCSEIGEFSSSESHQEQITR